MIESRKQSSNTILWVLGGILSLILGGCVLVFAAGVFLLTGGSSNPQIVPQRLSAESVPTRRSVAVVTPRPLVVIATPENGVDYETAVLENIYERVNPSVVNNTVLGQGNLRLPDGTLPRGFGPEDFLPISSGSGFVWDIEGYIVTNHHVVEGADQVQITFSDGTVAVAEVVGADADSDLAVLRIDPEGYNLLPVQRGKLEDVRVGMRVAAIGNPFGLEGTLTSGIVSAMGRSIPARESFSIPDSIQTDAAINPGNSGGPLLNERGELIGVNAQIRSEVRSNSGVGFAIPVTIIERVVPALIAGGVYHHSYMGISGGTFSPICAHDLGLPAMVLEVLPNTPASKAGLRGGDQPSSTRYPSICPEQIGGDLIRAINDQPITKFDDLLVYLQRYTSPGDSVTLAVWRDGEEVLIDVTLEQRPDTLQR
jgi:2-alkenal reductase